MEHLWRLRALLSVRFGGAKHVHADGFEDGVDDAGHRRRTVVGFWASVIAVPISSVLTIVALSRHLPPGDLAKVSTIFSLAFIFAVLPMAAQSQAAADMAARGWVGRVHWPPIHATIVAAALASPVLAHLLGLPLPAILLPVLMVLPAVGVGAARGELIARRSYRAAAINHWIDAATRTVAGVVLGIVFGASGVGAALLIATVVSWLVLPLLPVEEGRELRLPTALIAAGLLTLSIQLDVLLSPRLLGVGADAFDVAALPAKGVYMALMAGGWLVIPAAVGFRSVRASLQPLVLTAVGGVVLTIGAVVAVPLLGIVLGKGTPERGLVLVLGLAMAAAAANWVCLQIRLARGAASLWPPAVIAMVLTTGGGVVSGSAAGLALGILVGQVFALIVGGWSLARETLAAPAGVEVVESADAADAVAAADTIDARARVEDPASLDQVSGRDRVGDRWPADEPPVRTGAPAPAFAAAAVASAPCGPGDHGGPGFAQGAVAPPRFPLFNTSTAARLRARRVAAPTPAGARTVLVEPAIPASRTPRRALAWVSAALVLAAALQRPGDLVEETKLDVTLDAATFLGRTWHLWEPVADMGHVQNQAVGYLFPMGPFFLVGQLLHVPLWLIQRGWMGLLLVMAFWGMTRLADEFGVGTPVARLVGGLAYALSPFFIARVGTTSAFVMGGAMLPWILLPLVRTARVGSIRRGAALSGLAVFAIGGINGAVTLAVLVAPFLWLVTRERGRRRNQLLTWWLLAVFLACAWWIIPLVFQLRYGFNFLPFTERSATTTAYTSATEVLRGTGDWLSYLHLREGWIPAGWALVAEPIAIAGSVLMAALGLFGLARRDLGQRTFLVLTFLAGVAVVGAGYGGLFGNPMAGVVRSMLDGPAGLFRNVYKFQPLVALPLAFGFMHTLALVLGWATSARHITLATRRRIHTEAPLVALMLVLLGALPLLSNQVVSDKGFTEIPKWWTDFEADQNATSSPERTLVLPGVPAGDYTWGRTLDEPLQTESQDPWALRSLIPLGGPGSTRVLDAVEQAIERGGDTGLVEYLQRAGISRVVARNDIKWNDWNAPRPLQVHRALLASGLTPLRSFGPNLPLTSDTSDPGFAVDGAEHDLHALELYDVGAGTPTMVQSYSVADAAVLSGGPEAGLALARAGLGDRATILAGDLAADQTHPSNWIVTDTLQRRYVEFGLMRSNFSYALGPNEPGPDGKPLTTQLLPTDGTQHQTVAHLAGVAGVSASSYGSWLYQIPEVSPANALDGDPDTVWVAGPTHSSQGEWWRTDFEHPMTLPSIDIRLLEDGSWRPAVTALRVTTEAGSVVTAVQPTEDTQTLAVPDGATSWLKISFETVGGETSSSAGAGLREVTIPGVTVTRELVTPSELAAQFRAPNQPAPTYVFERATSDPRSLLRRDEEVTLNRSFVVPHDSALTMSGTATAVPGTALFALLDGDRTAKLRVQASSTLADLPEYDARQLVDGRDDTLWAAQPPEAGRITSPGAPGRDNPAEIGADPRLDQVAPSPQRADAAPTVSMQWDERRTLDEVTLTTAAGFSRPRRLKITSPDGEREAPVGPDGVARFPALTTSSVTVAFAEVEPRTTRNPLDGSLTTLPVGLAGLRFPALADLAAPTVDTDQPVRVSCADGPSVSIDGVSHHFSIDTTAAGLTSLTPLPVRDCGPDAGPAAKAAATGAAIRLAAGEHHLTTAPGTAPFNVTDLVLRDAKAITTGTDPRPVRLSAWGNEDRRITVDPGPAAYVAVNENFSSGWDATLDGVHLDAVRLDGWRQAFVVPGGAGGVIQLHFKPAGAYQVGLAAGLILVLLLLALALVPDRRRVRPSRAGEAVIPVWVWTGLIGVASVWIAGVAAVLVVPLFVLTRRRPTLLPFIAAASMLVSGAFVVIGGGRGPQDHLGAFGLGAQLLASVAILAVATATLVAVRSAPPASSSSPVRGATRPMSMAGAVPGSARDESLFTFESAASPPGTTVWERLRTEGASPRHRRTIEVRRTERPPPRRSGPVGAARGPGDDAPSSRPPPGPPDP